MWAVLAVVVLLPTAGASAFAAAIVAEKARTVAAADEALDAARAFAALVELRAATIDLRIGAVGGAATTGLGVDPRLVSRIIGRDPVAVATAARRQADAAWRRLSDLVEDDPPPWYGRLREAWERDGPGRERPTVSFAPVTPRTDEAIGAALGSATDRLRTTARNVPGGGRLSAVAIEAVHLLERADLVAAQTEAAAVIAVTGMGIPLSLPDRLAADPARRVVETTAQLDLLDRFTDRRVLPPEVLGGLAAIESDAAYRRVAGTLERIAAGGTVTAAEAPGLLADALRRLASHVALVEPAADAVVEQAGAVRAGAAAERARALRWLGVLVAGIASATAAAAWAISRPLGRARVAAVDVLEGHPVRSFRSRVREIDDLGSVLADVDSRIRAIEQRARSLLGEPDPSGDGAVGHRFGEAVQAALGRLAEATRRLRRSEALARAVVSSAAEAIWIVEPGGTIRSANAAAVAMVGRPEADQLGTSLAELAAPGSRDALMAAVTGGTRAGGVEAVVVRSDGTRVPVLVSTAPVENPDEPLLTVLARDISDRKRFEDELARTARTDPLTGLPNRRAALDVLARHLGDTRGGPVAVVFCDLDGFKQINDTFGHARGDQILCEVARRFEAVVRATETLCRLGGDEFLVVLRTGDLGTAVGVARRLAATLDGPVPLSEDGESVRLTGSFGVAVARTGDDPLSVIGRADIALYRAKAAGDGSVVGYDAALDADVERRGAIERSLRRALRTGEGLRLVYQPIVEAGTARAVAVEALLRWEDPDLGPVPPSEFIPVAETTGLVVELDRWVIGAVCDQMVRWSGHPLMGVLPVHVNVSGRHLGRAGLARCVGTELGARGLTGDRLVVEVTETHLIDDTAAAAAEMGRLADLGVATAVDDYGAGFASIATLRRLPVRAVKIDRQLVAEVTTEGGRALVASVIATARTLGLTTVAEGVETLEQHRILLELGADALQGYLFSRPVPPGVVSAHLGGVPAANV